MGTYTVVLRTRCLQRHKKALFVIEEISDDTADKNLHTNAISAMRITHLINDGRYTVIQVSVLQADT